MWSTTAHPKDGDDIIRAPEPAPSPSFLTATPRLPRGALSCGRGDDEGPACVPISKAHWSQAHPAKVSGQRQIYVQECTQGALSIKFQMFALQMFHLQFGNLGMLEIAFAHKIACNAGQMCP